jgi:hypothetical protein
LLIADCAISFTSLGLPIKKTTTTNVDTNLSGKITCRESINHCFLFGKFHSPTKCIACAPIAGNDSNDTQIHAATIHAIHVFIVVLFLRVISASVTVASYRCVSRKLCVRFAQDVAKKFRSPITKFSGRFEPILL